MAYATTNPPRLMVQGVGGSPAWWSYDSADAAATVDDAGYISNGDDLGMKVGDIVIQSDSAAGAVAHIYQVMAVAEGGGADLSTGTAIAVTNLD